MRNGVTMIPSKGPRVECQGAGTTTSLAGEGVDDNNNRSNTCGTTVDAGDSDHHKDGHHVKDHEVSKQQGHGQVSRRPGVSAAKYQLRPRSFKSRYLCDQDWSLQDALDHKPRAAPLSRYRRKTANARERCRMRQINNAFDSLRGVLPSWVCRRQAAAEMTKIATLRLASAYIRSLQDILDGNAPQDTCAWVLSGVFGEDHEPQQGGAEGVPGKLQQLPQPELTQDTDLFTLLYSAEEATPLNSLDTFSEAPPDVHTDPVKLFINFDPQIPWQQQQQQQQHSFIT